MISKRHLLLNFALFQLAWFACVLGGANGLPAAGLFAVAIAVGVHLYLSAAPATEFRLVLIVGLLGAAWDSFVVSAGLMSYPSGMMIAGVAPYWIIAMWINFAVTLNVSMGWLKARPLLAAVFGALGGPLSYLAGYKLGGVDIPDLWVGLGVQAAGWAAIMPSLTVLAGKVDGVVLSKGQRTASEEAFGVTGNV
ncbi:MAG: DUF2878 domain-containing protein [Gammaproteobacteria bacterium]|nr:DUF2878 domain-containing protein [Gammaproteobacteria bacterium]